MSDLTKDLLSWLRQRWLSARLLRSISNGAAGFLVLTSILASFASSIIATGSIDFFAKSRVAAVVIAGIPGICLTLWRQFPFREWGLFQNTRYVLYRKIYFSLKYGTIDLPTAVQQVNASGEAIASIKKTIPFIDMPTIKPPKGGE